MEGYIKLYRKLLDSPTFDNPNLLKVFVWCLLKATHTEYKQVVGLQTVTLIPGQFIYGRDKASEELHMNPSSVYKYTQFLKSIGNINIQSNNKFSVVTVANWELYQHDAEKSNSKSNNKVTTKEQQSNTNKNGKNDKNNKLQFETSSKPYQCAVYLDAEICKRVPKPEATEEQLQKSAKEFDLANRADGYDWELIESVLMFSQKSEFWKKNILSSSKFREKIVMLLSQMGGK